ncbi:MAG: Rieske 2Fe-2S domain-containing protein [Hydrogenophaga sp.]|uniref:Rieske 2Fe-2S domain-containing protein n=1 Tax=Hydrogenophaga sp. TaxID=1904254 RepID=UPI001D2C1511|nr:Rieske 2Fe-2S domain-containing protein [Hydrogenophaga sp.]MBX3610252.1 Rieske 2Fe-2S domain-containing protein [Hydrogenophaga sp.]
MKAELNQRLTQVGPGTPAGELLRRYWQPVALLDEFDPAIDPAMAVRPVKPVRLLGQNFVLFKDAQGRFGMLDRDCPHRGADLAFGRNEGDGLRCPFHGWKFDVEGRCLETPAEPVGSTLCQRVRQQSYPLVERSGVLFAWLGAEGKAPPLPALDCFEAPASHTFAFKGLWNCNWLQSLEVGIDPAHASYLHRFFNDASLDDAYGKQFRGASAGEVEGERWPMTRVMREFGRPDISHEAKPWGLQLTALRQLNEQLTHVRVTNAVFPQTFVIPLSETMTITQMHVPVDDTHNYWYAFFTSFDAPVDKAAMRTPRLQAVTLPFFEPKMGRHNHWGFNPQEQVERTYLGMGEDDINVHDQWACESMGAIQDRTREHLGTSDKVIMAHRRLLQQAIDAVENGGDAPGIASTASLAEISGPDTIDGFAPTGAWQDWWQTAVRERRERAPWTVEGKALADAAAALGAK